MVHTVWELSRIWEVDNTIVEQIKVHSHGKRKEHSVPLRSDG